MMAESSRKSSAVKHVIRLPESIKEIINEKPTK
jgi:hypothetical protein